MIQPLIEQPHDVTDKDVKNLITIARIEEPSKTNIK